MNIYETFRDLEYYHSISIAWSFITSSLFFIPVFLGFIFFVNHKKADFFNLIFTGEEDNLTPLS